MSFIALDRQYYTSSPQSMFCIRCCITQLKNMTGENSTANQSVGNTSETLRDAPIEPAFQLALTVEFYFRYAVLVIGIFGTAANALVLYALIAHHARDAKKRVINLLIIHQNILDLACCILLVTTVCIQLGNTYLTGAAGYFLCSVFVNGTAIHCTTNGSTINLVVLTVERYLKVVHSVWSKKKIKRWMVYAAMSFAWIGGSAIAAPVSFMTSRLHDGFCIAYLESRVSHLIFASCNLVLLFVIPLSVFIYCYGRIVVVIRTQTRIMAGYDDEEGSSQMSTSEAQSNRVKWNVIKTMIIVSVAFIVSWFPVNMYLMLLSHHGEVQRRGGIISNEHVRSSVKPSEMERDQDHDNSQCCVHRLVVSSQHVPHVIITSWRGTTTRRDHLK